MRRVIGNDGFHIEELDDRVRGPFRQSLRGEGCKRIRGSGKGDQEEGGSVLWVVQQRAEGVWCRSYLVSLVFVS
jgi:hypothetical protein